MGTKWTKMTVKETTKKRIMVDFKKQFLKKHPEMSGLKITEEFMINQLVLNCLEEKYEYY